MFFANLGTGPTSFGPCGDAVWAKQKLLEQGASATAEMRSRVASYEDKCPDPCERAKYIRDALAAAARSGAGNQGERAWLDKEATELEQQCSGSSVSTKILYGALAFVGVALVVRLLRQ